MTAADPARPRTRKRRERHLRYDRAASLLRVTQGKKETSYTLAELPHDLGPSCRCFRLTKAAECRRPDDPESYDVAVNADGTGSCECLGALRHPATVCRHRAALAALVARELL